MCVGNRADNAVRYVNAQLAVAWENAKYCTEKHGNGSRPTKREIEHGTCIYEFFGPADRALDPARKEYSFYAKFDAPYIEFICDHELLLHSIFKDGHYCLDTAALRKDQ